ncbi:MAG: hypothetical protein IH946_01090, partial [Bacteroidetes bacterium]|nr:hypothetical protein [Bacteroidota bacterium]
KESGFKADKDVRDIKLLRGSDDNPLIIIGNNNERVQILENILGQKLAVN